MQQGENKRDAEQWDEHSQRHQHQDFLRCRHSRVMNYEQFAHGQHSIKESNPVGAGAGTLSDETSHEFIIKVSEPPSWPSFSPIDPRLYIHIPLMNGE